MMIADPSRTPVLLVHGWAGSSRAWGPVIPEFASAGIRARVLAVDLPGSPLSTRPGDATIPRAVEHVISVAESMDEPPLLVGHSMGGQISLLVHARRPDLVAAEVVIDPAYGAQDAEAAGMRLWAAAIEADGAGALVDFFASGFGVLPTGARAAILDDLRATPADALASYLRSEYLDDDAVGFFPATSAVAKSRTRPLLAFHSSERGEQVEHALHPPTGSVVRRWDGHGHFLHLEDQARFARETAQWMQGGWN